MKVVVKKPKIVLKPLRKIKISSVYTSFLAFLMNLEFNQSRTLSISALKEYHPLFLSKFEESFNRDLTQSIKITVSEDDDFNTFLNEFKQYFSINGDEITLNEDITISDIKKILEKVKPIDNSTGTGIFIIAYDNEIKTILKLDGIKKMITEFLKLEGIIEKYYSGMQSINDNSELNSLLQERNSFYYQLLAMGEDFLYNCNAEISTFEDSDSVHPYDSFYPVNPKYRLEPEASLDMDETYVDEVLCDSYFFAIFTNIPLAFRRIIEDIENLNWHHSFVLPSQNPDSSYQERMADDTRKTASSSGNFVYTTRRAKEKLFFLTYVQEINRLQKIYGENQELNNSKTRVLYLLDDFSANLLQEDSFEIQYQKVSQNLDEDDDFEWYKVLIIALIP